MTGTAPCEGRDHGLVDVAVVGGGINGAGIARDAAGRGLKVLLCEKDDFAEGTSSRSGKLVHGGLRYLEYYEFRLVREALVEREVLLASAPHIIWPMRFVLPHSPEQRPAGSSAPVCSSTTISAAASACRRAARLTSRMHPRERRCALNFVAALNIRIAGSMMPGS
jgi:glycerol-3-phosphate dehydrogenase